MKKLIIISIFFLSGIIAFSQNVIKAQNDINNQYDLEITYNQSGTVHVGYYTIQITTNLQSFSVGNPSTTVIISFRIRPADCPGPWVDFDYYVYGYGFTNFCLGCDDPKVTYIAASVGYDGKDWVGIKCTETTN